MGRGRWWRLALCGLFLMGLALARLQAYRLADIPDLRLLSLNGESLTGSAAWALARQEEGEQQPAAFVLWGQRVGQVVENPDLARSTTLNVLLLAGDSPLLVPSDAPLLSGDTEGCLLDEGTAMELFGSPAPVGSQVRWNGRTLTVRGILSGKRPVLAVQALASDTGLGRLALQIPAGSWPHRYIVEFSGRLGLDGVWGAARTWAGIAGFFSQLPVWVLVLSAISPLLRTGFRALEYPAVFLACLLTAGALWFAGLWLTGFSMQIPPELLPAQWSDFDFWVELLREKQEELARFFLEEKTEYDLGLFLPAAGAVAAGIGTVLLMPLSLSRVKAASGRGLWALCAGTLVFSFLAALYTDGALAADRPLWLAPPLYWVGDYVARKLAGWAKQVQQTPEDA